MKQFWRRLVCVWDGHLFGCVNEERGRYCARCGEDWWNVYGR